MPSRAMKPKMASLNKKPLEEAQLLEPFIDSSITTSLIDRVHLFHRQQSTQLKVNSEMISKM